MKQNTKKVFRSLTLCVYALLTLTPPPSNAAIFFNSTSTCRKEMSKFLSALVQDTFACQMLCPQSTCNLIARRTTIIEDKDADCGVTDGLLHQDLNCQLSYCTTGPKQITVNCPRVNCRLVGTHRVTWLIWSVFCSLWVYLREKLLYTEDKILLEYRNFAWSSPLIVTSFWWMGFPEPEGRLLSCDLFLVRWDRRLMTAS